MAHRFPDAAKVIFIGDSITSNGLYIAHIYDHYLRAFPHCGIRMYNCGVSGGSTTSALEYLDRHGLNFAPTHAVIMLGINDISRGLYELPADAPDFIDKQLQRRMDAIAAYQVGMRKLTGLLAARGVRITLIAPLGIDEAQRPRELTTIGCDAGVEMLGEFCRRLAMEIGADFINLRTPMRFYNTVQTLTRPDRVHPLETGHVLMARVLLAAQGLADEPNALDLDTLPAPDALLPRNAARYSIETIHHRLWDIEWLVFRRQPDLQTYTQRMTYLQEFRKRWEPGSFWLTLCDNYEQYGMRPEAVLQRLLDATDACVAP